MASELTNEQFDIAFSEWERHRMYPKYYGKDCTMTKLAYRHIAAITRAQNLLETSVNVEGNPELNSSVRRDISLLTEVRDILYHFYENPQLPFAEQVLEIGGQLLNQIEDEPDEAH